MEWSWKVGEGWRVKIVPLDIKKKEGSEGEAWGGGWNEMKPPFGRSVVMR